MDELEDVPNPPAPDAVPQVGTTRCLASLPRAQQKGIAANLNHFSAELFAEECNAPFHETRDRWVAVASPDASKWQAPQFSCPFAAISAAIDNGAQLNFPTSGAAARRNLVGSASPPTKIPNTPKAPGVGHMPTIGQVI